MSWLLLASRYGRTCVVKSTIEKANMLATITEKRKRGVSAEDGESDLHQQKSATRAAPCTAVRGATKAMRLVRNSFCSTSTASHHL